MSTSDRDKIRVLLPHWKEHNQSHGAEFGKWAAAARAEGMEEVAELLGRAMEKLAEVDHLLEHALEQAGGPVDGHSHSHGHGHHHH